MISSLRAIESVFSETSSASSGVLKIYINNELFLTSGELLLDGASKTYTLKGSGSSNTYKVLIDDSTVLQEGKVDFTKKPAVVSDVINYEETVLLIDVINKTRDEAVSQLKTAGFTNIEVVEVSSNDVAAGLVVSQNPAADGVKQVSKSTKIVLEVSTGPSA